MNKVVSSHQLCLDLLKSVALNLFLPMDPFFVGGPLQSYSTKYELAILAKENIGLYSF